MYKAKQLHQKMLFLVALLAMISCGKTVIAQDKSADSNRRDFYRFSAGEMLRIQVLDEPDLNSHYTINETGSILFPLLGKVHVSCLNAPEIERMLTKLLQDGYIHNPIIHVSAINPKMVYILGAIQKPGAYPLSPKADTILHIVAMAGGFDAQADQTRFGITRTEHQTLNVESSNITNNSISALYDAQTSIYDGDIITVQPSSSLNLKQP